MNERMLELARGSGLKKHPSEDREYIGDFDWREFGDLVVKECIKVVEDTPLGYKDYRGQIEDVMRSVCVMEIKHKFGIE